MDLKELRAKLDEIDEELVNVIAKRVALIPEVAKYKKENGLPRKDAEREDGLIEAKRKIATELGVSPELVEDVFRRLIQESHIIEKEIIGE